ncbi:MAG: hypothetical protein PHI63_02290 [Patescibacteria group bacterium]|nr:hypothetical protein [Patescibacteria group bacterium]
MGNDRPSSPPPGRLLWILIALAAGTAVLATASFWPTRMGEHRGSAGASADPSREIIARWQTGLADIVTTFENSARTLKKNLTDLQQQMASLMPTPLDTAAATAIQQRLEQRIAGTLGLDWNGLTAALPSDWSGHIVTLPPADKSKPQTTLMLQSRAPCTACKTADGCPKTPAITLAFYPPDIIPTPVQISDCRMETIATTTAYTLIDTCGNDPCEERKEIRQMVVSHLTLTPTTQP